MAARESFDVITAGGGVIGSAIAYFLTRERGVTVAVVEPDPSYEFAATPRSAGGIRAQFSTRANVLMSLFGAEFLLQAGDLLEVDEVRPELGFRQNGYLVLASAAGVAAMRANHAVQTGCGADVVLMGKEDLAARFPWLDTAGIAQGSFGRSGEGWLDAYSLLQGFRKKAIAQGARYIRDRVVGLGRRGGRIGSVSLRSGQVLTCGSFVNAAGTNGRAIAEMAGIPDLPVHAKKRQIFVFTCRETVEAMPLVIDPSGVYCRPEGAHFITGRAPPRENDPTTASFEVDHRQFEADIWPHLAARIPRFEAIKVVNAWAGHYDMNVIDQNPVLGADPETRNFLFANGFSGHGLQKSPAVGRGIAELILHGRYLTIDLSEFGFDRFAAGRPILERNVF